MIHDALSGNNLGISNPSQVGVDIKMTLPLLVAALCFNGAGIGGQQVREIRHKKGLYRLKYFSYHCASMYFIACSFEKL